LFSAISHFAQWNPSSPPFIRFAPVTRHKLLIFRVFSRLFASNARSSTLDAQPVWYRHKKAQNSQKTALDSGRWSLDGLFFLITSYSPLPNFLSRRSRAVRRRITAIPPSNASCGVSTRQPANFGTTRCPCH
jgi:hypothetical protein